MSDTLSYLLMAWSDPQLLMLTALGTFAGIYIGAIPGLSVTMAVSILVSFTFSWDVNDALALIVGIFIGGVYGGSRSAILLNIPGAPSSVATAFDGYPLAQQGEAGRAIGLSTVMSVVGGIVGTLMLASAAPLIGDLALRFAPRDYFLVAAIGLLLVGSLTEGSLAKGIFAAALGAVIGLVGMDPVTAQGRFTLGQVELMGGIHYVVLMIGLFGVAEAFYQLHNLDSPVIRQKVDKILPSFAMVLKFLPLSIRTSIIGVIVGVLPGVGGDIAALMAYDHAKRTVKNPTKPFGKGAYEGLVAPETANSAAACGSMVPMLTLGVPGSGTTAVMLGALTLYNITPGPLLFQNQPDIVWGLIASLFVANIMLIIMNVPMIKVFTKVLAVPYWALVPAVAIITAIGVYAVHATTFDLYLMIAIGLFGYVMRKLDFPLSAILLGFILGGMMEQNLRRALSLSSGDLGILYASPITWVVWALVAVMIVLPFWRAWRARRQQSPVASEA